MANYSRDWDELGRNIQDIVDHAIQSQDYQKLNQSIRQVVETAVDLGGDAVKKAADLSGDAIKKAAGQVRQQTEQKKPTLIYREYQPKVVVENRKLPALYRKTGWKTAVGVLKTVAGGMLAFVSSGSLIMALAAMELGASVVLALMLGGGIALLTGGIKGLNRLSRFKAYVRILGGKTHCSLERLAKAVGKSTDFVRKELNRMIGDGLFLEGHLDNEEANLITSHETYRQYEQSRLALEARQREEQEKLAQTQVQQIHQTIRQDDRKERTHTPQVQEVLSKGSAYIREIRRCNDLIPGEEISAKIDRMELVVRRIFQRADDHPEVVDDLKKMMDYYLPMTVKLLNAYADMDAQPVQGETIQKSKQEIEDTLDTLILAFEKLLDSIFKETALDVSSDISVLNTLLAQEGLVEDDFEKMKKQL